MRAKRGEEPHYELGGRDRTANRSRRSCHATRVARMGTGARVGPPPADAALRQVGQGPAVPNRGRAGNSSTSARAIMQPETQPAVGVLLKSLGKHMPRQRYQRGSLEKVGKVAKKWQGRYQVYVKLP